MALCLASSLVVTGGFCPYDQLVRYKWWYKHGYMSSTGKCFDIGAATKDSLDTFEQRQIKFMKKHNISSEQIDSIADDELLREFKVECSRKDVAGNGALMRLAPVPLFFHSHPRVAVEFSGISGRITHGDTKAYDACRYYGALIVGALHGLGKNQLLANDFYAKHKDWFGTVPLCSEIRSIAEGSFKKKGGYDDGIRGKGYIVDALQAALWAFWADEGSFSRGVLAAVNLGDDTDTTAAIYGQLAGAYYGYTVLPGEWSQRVYARKFIANLGTWIAYEGARWRPDGNVHAAMVPSQVQTDTPEAIREARSIQGYPLGGSQATKFLQNAPDAELVSTADHRHRSQLRGIYSDASMLDTRLLPPKPKKSETAVYDSVHASRSPQWTGENHSGYPFIDRRELNNDHLYDRHSSRDQRLSQVQGRGTARHVESPSRTTKTNDDGLLSECKFK